MTRRAWELIRMALVIRSLGTCERCNRPLPNDWEAQHRRARGMGGTRRADVHSVPNLLALCPQCHDEVERHDRANAFELGHAIRQGADPAATPVFIRGRWVLLTADGRYAAVERHTA